MYATPGTRGGQTRTSPTSTGFSFLPAFRLTLKGLTFSFVGLELGTSVRPTRLTGVDARGGVATADGTTGGSSGDDRQEVSLNAR